MTTTPGNVPAPRSNADDHLNPVGIPNLFLTGIPSTGKGTHMRALRSPGHIPGQRTAGGDEQC